MQHFEFDDLSFELPLSVLCDSASISDHLAAFAISPEGFSELDNGIEEELIDPQSFNLSEHVIKMATAQEAEEFQNLKDLDISAKRSLVQIPRIDLLNPRVNISGVKSETSSLLSSVLVLSKSTDIIASLNVYGIPIGVFPNGIVNIIEPIEEDWSTSERELTFLRVIDYPSNLEKKEIEEVEENLNKSQHLKISRVRIEESDAGYTRLQIHLTSILACAQNPRKFFIAIFSRNNETIYSNVSEDFIIESNPSSQFCSSHTLLLSKSCKEFQIKEFNFLYIYNELSLRIASFIPHRERGGISRRKSHGSQLENANYRKFGIFDYVSILKMLEITIKKSLSDDEIDKICSFVIRFCWMFSRPGSQFLRKLWYSNSLWFSKIIENPLMMPLKSSVFTINEKNEVHHNYKERSYSKNSNMIFNISNPKPIIFKDSIVRFLIAEICESSSNTLIVRQECKGNGFMSFMYKSIRENVECHAFQGSILNQVKNFLIEKEVFYETVFSQELEKTTKREVALQRKRKKSQSIDVRRRKNKRGKKEEFEQEEIEEEEIEVEEYYE